MNCIKCGREIKTSASQVFCSKCLTDMEAYPVKPNITIQLPVRQETLAEKRKPRKKKPQPTPEEQIPRLRSGIRLLCLVLAVLFIAFVLVTLMVIRLLDVRDQANTDARQGNQVVAVKAADECFT